VYTSTITDTPWNKRKYKKRKYIAKNTKIYKKVDKDKKNFL